jgi:hypothetical protein
MYKLHLGLNFENDIVACYSDYRRVLDCQLDLLGLNTVTQLGYSVLHFTTLKN